MSLVEVASSEHERVFVCFRGFFNSSGNNYSGAIGYFHSLKKEQQTGLREHPVLGPLLDLAIDNFMYEVCQTGK